MTLKQYLRRINRWKMSTKFQILFVGAWLLLGIYGSLFTFGGHDGSHAGIVTAVEYNSNILWPATLVYVKTGLKSRNETIYCVNDELLKKRLIELSKIGEFATIYYSNNPAMWKWECNGGKSIIYKVEECGQNQTLCPGGISETRFGK